MRTHSIFPEAFPEPWASDWGEDEYGLWIAFTYKGVRQGFRWIEAGTFMMGSPGDEPERFEDEVQHKVKLSKGFWLADTTVTQLLWEAVMDNNPARFKGENRPVESISWDDAQAFIDRMNGTKAELALRLPTEAQWEYACRAGTATPFYFGGNVTSEVVNFDGTRLYNNGRKSEYRQQTVDVKSLPCNDWGLYEMHGNVWEWCQDYWLEKLSTEPVTDPVGPESGVDRVLRGGSWVSDGRLVRSAYRDHDDPADRYGDGGFRLARGH